MRVASIKALLFLCLIGFSHCSRSPENDIQDPSSPPIATAGDSVFTLDRLEALLAATEDTLGREDIEAYLKKWAEDQAFAQSAIQASLLDDPRQREHLNRVQLRFLRGLLEESWISDPVDPSQRTLKRFYKKHSYDFVVPERQLKFAWYASPDSAHIADVLESLAENRLRREQLAAPDFEYGRSEFVEKRHMEPHLAAPLFELDYLDLSEILRDGENFIVYQVVGQRPKGYLLPFDAAEGMVRERYRQSVQSENLRLKRKELLQSFHWEMTLDPLYATDAQLLKESSAAISPTEISSSAQETQKTDIR